MTGSGTSSDGGRSLEEPCVLMPWQVSALLSSPLNTAQACPAAGRDDRAGGQGLGPPVSSLQWLPGLAFLLGELPARPWGPTGGRSRQGKHGLPAREAHGFFTWTWPSVHEACLLPQWLSE